MRNRYTRLPNGRLTKQCTLYFHNEHILTAKKINKHAITIIRRLCHHGYEAYIVGGAVRDLLYNKSPKDFDIATNAPPEKIRAIFKNSRIIGKRFRLVHIFFSPHDYIEISTFRSKNTDYFMHKYGSIDEDVLRRDFSINALFYDPLTEIIYDYCNAMPDIKNQKLRSIQPLSYTFKEDPIRIIRGIKYAITLSLHIPYTIERALIKNAPHLQTVSPSRLTDEFFKLLITGYSHIIFQKLLHYRNLQYILPYLYKHHAVSKKKIIHSLQELDTIINNNKIPNRETQLYYWIVKPLLSLPEYANANRHKQFTYIKQLIAPLLPPNKVIQKAIRYQKKI